MNRWLGDDEVRAALRDKYQRMLALREADRSGVAHDEDALRELAARYPGALRELDRAPLDVLRERIGVLDPTSDGALPDWAEPTLALHLALGWALDVRRAAGADRDRARASPVFAERADLLGFKPADLETLMNPPDGRLSRWLVGRLAQARGVTVVEVERRLFGHLEGHLRRGW